MFFSLITMHLKLKCMQKVFSHKQKKIGLLELCYFFNIIEDDNIKRHYFKTDRKVQIALFL